MPAVSSYGHRATKPRKQGQRFKFVWVIWKQTAARLRAGQRQPRDMSDRMMERREEAEVQIAWEKKMWRRRRRRRRTVSGWE
ncbi:uncharacterized protein ACBT44_017717 isoform 2-T3 [Syngnathus typhle]